ncbi:MAG: hypothetical protein AAFZ15_14735 [Bacteroidota bacterium]
MKIIHFFSVLSLFLLPAWTNAQSTIGADSTGMPGDHFSLEGALELFKNSESLEDFEKKLNQEKNDVNNLDLNEDGDIDYIRVIDNMDNDVHAIVLQVPVSGEESQDVAVIEIEKTGDEEAMLQIVGDVVIYGEGKIIEPFEVETKDDGRGPCVTVDRVYVNVFFWRPVRFIYGPRYRVYVSPFRWGYYPAWWRPWRPRPWRTFHTRAIVYRPHYRVATTHRVVRAHRVYAPTRRSSAVVRTRTVSRAAVGNNKAGVKRSTTTTTVTGKNGNTVTRSKTTTAAGAKGANGAAGAKRSTTTTRVTDTNGNTVTRKKKTTTAGKKGRNGSAAGKRTKTTTRKKRGN